MHIIDWIIVIIYGLGVIALSFFVGRRQKDQEDYYLGGRKVGPWLAGASMASNQVSAISLVGAPAFIALQDSGGLKWLQYELAIPLAMIFIAVFLVPLIRSSGGITIYQYLEERFGTETRLALSLIFLVSRSLATGVALLAASYVTAVCAGIPLLQTVIIIGAVSLVYTSIGGIMADIYSDIIQLVVLWGGAFVMIAVIIRLINGDVSFAPEMGQRLTVFDMASSGFGDGDYFSFWPMVFGGFFLYVSYYGCDQSQAQRLLAAGTSRNASKSLLVNSVIRYPLVLTYCALGLLLIPFMEKHPEFTGKVLSLPPDYLVPHFVNDYMPAGLLGLVIAGIFAASMSSLDSAINSLSAATWNDLLVKVFPGLDAITDRQKVSLSRVITVFWGVFSIAAAAFMAGGPDTVIELVNKIGSAFYGPIAAVFVLGIVLKRKSQAPPLGGLVFGMAVNIVLWLGFSSVSWMWWNLTGFAAALIAGTVLGVVVKGPLIRRERTGEISFSGLLRSAPRGVIALMTVWLIIIIGSSLYIHMIMKDFIRL